MGEYTTTNWNLNGNKGIVSPPGEVLSKEGKYPKFSGETPDPLPKGVTAQVISGAPVRDGLVPLRRALRPGALRNIETVCNCT